MELDPELYPYSRAAQIKGFIEGRRRGEIKNKLYLYYDYVFPSELTFKWLNYGRSDDNFARREISFTMVKGAMLRYQSFKDLDEWRRALLKEQPAKIDIGAMYNMSGKERKNKDFAPCEKELVFDIDLSDYDDVRYCCKGVNFCEKCWKFLAVGCKILDATLREDFGYEHLLWVFSGRRGIHCWVCDDSARILSLEARSAITDYVQLVKGGVYMPKKVRLEDDNIHHSVRRALDIINEYFITVCIKEQDILGSARKMAKFLNMLEDEDLKEVREEFLQQRTSMDRWSAFVKYIEELRDAGNLKSEHQHIVEEVTIQLLYPRLDTNVSKSVSHLLKSPFSVHPNTGRISIPFAPECVDQFIPLKVPHVEVFLKQVIELKEEFKVNYLQKTDLHESLVLFEGFVNNLENSREGKIVEQSLVPLQVRY